MDDEIRIERVQPYPSRVEERGGSREERPRHKRSGEGEKKKGAKGGHVDTTA